MEEYHRSKQVNSVEEFKKLFLDVLYGHRCVYEHVGVLHRNLGINNIMFSRRDGQVAGILCDCDSAIVVDEAGDGQGVNDTHVSSPSVAEGTSVQLRGGEEIVGNHKQDTNTSEVHIVNNLRPTHKVPHRSGTGPYMAIDLLVLKEAPRHLYRHDLESFFFIVAWFCAAFVPEEQAYDRSRRILKTWEEGTFEQIGEAKRRLLRGKSYGDLVQSAANPYKVLLDEWVRRLLLPFSQINIGYTVLMTDLRFRYSTGKITTIEFEKEREKMEQERGSVIDYDEFIRVLFYRHLLKMEDLSGTITCDPYEKLNVEVGRKRKSPSSLLGKRERPV